MPGTRLAIFLTSTNGQTTGWALKKIWKLDRQPEQIYFPHARRDQLGIIGRVPLASGLLTGKYKPGVTFAANDVRSATDIKKINRDLAEVERLQKIEMPRS